MISKGNFIINRFDFDSNVFNELYSNHYLNDLWPIVYILSDDGAMEAYVGETTDTFARMKSHLKNSKKKKLTAVHFISSEKFNKSATLDVESNLIKYISGDGQYKLLNANAGLANHNFYQKPIYWNLFLNLWDALRAKGISKHSVEYINNSDLFKYSPYKTLTTEQRQGLIMIIKCLLNDHYKHMVIEGGAGTGKTILAIFLFKLLKTSLDDFNFEEFDKDQSEILSLVRELKEKYPDPKMALVVPMSSFRKTLKKVFKNVKGLRASMVVGPTALSKEKYDIVLVDESHRLRRRVNIGTYFRAFSDACERLGLDPEKHTELNWVLTQAEKAILFYDENQSIKPTDVDQSDFFKLKGEKTTKVEVLKSQFRSQGGNDYVQYIGDVLNCKLESDYPQFISKKYQFLLFDSIVEMEKEIRLRNKEYGLSRLVAGFSWEWISNKSGRENEYDITIDGHQLRWNGVTEDWINSPNAINEVGCIHTTQAYDLNYVGVIFGNEITYDPATNQIKIIKENYFDKNGKNSVEDPEVLVNYITNIYKTLMLRGIRGTYVYACDNELRKYLARHIPPFEKPQKVIKLMDQAKIIPFKNCIPLYNLRAAAGDFSELQNVEELDWIELPQDVKASKELFACKVEGESMNKVIPNGSICLFKKYSGGSRNGQIVLVQHYDIQESEFGAGYTVKEYHSKKITTDEGWEHDNITLKPLSLDKSFENIVLEQDQLNDLKVIGIFVRVID
jgi:DUF2075 family protein/SOS-response transcriptional repressor LexA/predicted GIY-YIG superfamily endonuclease